MSSHVNIASVFPILIFACGQIICCTKQWNHFMRALKWLKTSPNSTNLFVVFRFISTLTKHERGFKLQEIIFLLWDYSGGEAGFGEVRPMWQSLIICSTAEASRRDNYTLLSESAAALSDRNWSNGRRGSSHRKALRVISSQAYWTNLIR